MCFHYKKVGAVTFRTIFFIFKIRFEEKTYSKKGKFCTNPQTLSIIRIRELEHSTKFSDSVMLVCHALEGKIVQCIFVYTKNFGICVKLC